MFVLNGVRKDIRRCEIDVIAMDYIRYAAIVEQLNKGGDTPKDSSLRGYFDEMENQDGKISNRKKDAVRRKVVSMYMSPLKGCFSEIQSETIDGIERMISGNVLEGTKPANHHNIQAYVQLRTETLSNGLEKLRRLKK